MALNFKGKDAKYQVNTPFLSAHLHIIPITIYS